MRISTVVRIAFTKMGPFALALGLTACLGGGSGGGEISTSGLITRIDTSQRTFSIKTNDGKDLDFRMTNSTRGDIKEIKTHYDTQKPLDVRYKSGTPPLEATYAD